MAAPVPQCMLALRGSHGVWFIKDDEAYTEDDAFKRDVSTYPTVSTYSVDGSLYAWANKTHVHIYDMTSKTTKLSMEMERPAGIVISPCNGYFATIQPYSVDRGSNQGVPNMFVWNMKTGEKLRGFCQKKVSEWMPQWSCDDKIACRLVNNELQFYEDNNWDNTKTKLHMQKVTAFSMSPAPAPYRVAVYVPGVKGQPSFVRVYTYPRFAGHGDALANKSFYKSDKVEMHWNGKGTAILIHTFTDSSDSSYYGDQGLHFISVHGNTSHVPMGKRGPIYGVQWHPDGQEFCVVYGYMPAKATVYNMKAEPIFDFGEGKRNAIFYNPRGNLLCLAGFGNLAGFVEVWDMGPKTLVTSYQAPFTTFFQWCPDGERMLTATTSPRLKVENGYKIWHYSGTLLCAKDLSSISCELNDARWRPMKASLFPLRPISKQPVKSSFVPEKPVVQKAAAPYRPPCAQGQAPSFKLHNEPEKASNQKEVPKAALSKSALKNKKRREKSKAAAEEGASSETPAPQHQPPPGGAAAGPQGAGGLSETEKKMRNLKKKLQQVEKLKSDMASGKQLEKNQMEKLQTEAALLKEMESLSLQ